jgi:hypothetical protein
MRRFALLVAAAALAACSAPPNTTTLTLKNPYWKQVNVELVITKRADCGSRGPGFVSEQTIVMYQNAMRDIAVPNDATLCWRHDRDPDKPQPGAWSDWTRATLTPGESAESDL